MCLVMVVTARAGPPIRDHPPLRKSLFPNVPPTINFILPTENLTYQLPPAIRRTLLYQKPWVGHPPIHQSLQRSGFTSSSKKKINESALVFMDLRRQLINIKSWQMKSVFYGIGELGKKSKLWTNYKKKRDVFGEDFAYMPKTFLYPQERNELKKEMFSVGKDGRWISKPDFGGMANGIFVTNNFNELPERKTQVISRYIDHPYLIDGQKFSFRLYSLITCLDPLTVYLYKEGLVFFASFQYTNDEDTLSRRGIHFSNIFVNKNRKNKTGHFTWGFNELRKHFKAKGISFAPIWENIKDLVIKSTISAESSLNLQNSHESRNSSFAWFGVDIILDSTLKPWLCEYNANQVSLSVPTKAAKEVDVPMVKELLNLARYHIPDRITKKTQMKLAKSLHLPLPLCFDERQYSNQLFTFEREKQTQSTKFLKDSILDELTPADTRVLIASEDELEISERFERIFPTKETHRYLKFFDEPRYYNTLLSAWEQRFSDDREAGRDILKSLCRDNFHTLVPIK